MPDEVEQFGVVFRRFLERVVEDAGEAESPVRVRLREHLGADPLGVPVVGARFAPFEHPDVQVALDGYLAAGGRHHVQIAFHGHEDLAVAVPGGAGEAGDVDGGDAMRVHAAELDPAEPAALDALRQELQDRFGTPPPAVERLLLVIALKLLARQLFLERIEQRGLEVLLTFHPQTPIEPPRLLARRQRRQCV